MLYVNYNFKKGQKQNTSTIKLYSLAEKKNQRNYRKIDRDCSANEHKNYIKTDVPVNGSVSNLNNKCYLGKRDTYD